MEANFCLQCGTSLVSRVLGGVERKACPKCNFVHWGNYSVGVGALVIKDQKILLVRRAEEPGKGYWTVPGGYIEQYEHLDKTIEREVLEETGVDALTKGMVAVRDLPRSLHNVYLVFSMDYVQGEPKADGHEVDGAGFFSLEEMQSMKVAALTKWVVEIGLTKKSPGLLKETNETETMKGYGLYRITE